MDYPRFEAAQQAPGLGSVEEDKHMSVHQDQQTKISELEAANLALENIIQFY